MFSSMFEVVEDHVDLIERCCFLEYYYADEWAGHKVTVVGYHQKKITHLTLQRKR